MKKYLFILSAILALSSISCQKKSTMFSAQTFEPKIDKTIFDSISIKDSTAINTMLSLKFSSKMLYFPTIKNKLLLKQIYFQNDGLKDYSKKGIENYLTQTKSEYFESVKKENTNLDVQFSQKWYSDSSMKVVSFDNDYLQIQYFQNVYDGGAHGNYQFSHRIFDLKANKNLSINEITTMPKPRLEALLKQNIDKIPSRAKNSQGHIKNSEMLLVDKISVTDNFYFDGKNLYFHYSPYEITAYAAGDVIIPISWEDLKNTLTPEFKERMKL